MQLAITLTSVAGFVVMMMISIGNQLSGKTWKNYEVLDIDQVLYPSVSVCQKYPYEDGVKLNHILKDMSGNISSQDKINKAVENVRNVDKLFYFVHHSGMKTKPFPCTVHGGTAKGHCSFPFVDPFTGNMSTSCVPDPVEEESWCLTKIYKSNDTTDSWGYCSKDCKGM